MITHKNHLFIPLIFFYFVILSIILSCSRSASKENPKPNISITSGLSIESINDSILMFPENPILWYKRGVLHYENGDQTLSIRDFTKALELDSNYTSAWHDRAICYFELDQFDSALSGFTQTIIMDDTFYEAYFNRALVYEALGKTANAISDYNQCIKIDSTFAPAYYNRAVHLFSQNKSSACKDFKKAADFGDQDAENAYIEHCK